MAVDLVLAIVSSAPAWSNLASLAYARRAQGRPKIAFLVPLLVAMCVCVAALAFVPRTGTGLIVFFVLYAVARLLWAGVETVRSVLWSVNYPTRLRARITGRITINTSIALAFVGLGVGWLLGREGPWWRIAIVAGAACGIAGTMAFQPIPGAPGAGPAGRRTRAIACRGYLWSCRHARAAGAGQTLS